MLKEKLVYALISVPKMGCDRYTAEYVYGNHFERLVEDNKKKSKEEKDSSSGLRDLISGDSGSAGRVLHRKSVVNSNGSSSV